MIEPGYVYKAKGVNIRYRVLSVATHLETRIEWADCISQWNRGRYAVRTADLMPRTKEKYS